MKKLGNKKIIIGIVIAVIILIGVGIGTYFILKDEYKLTVDEKEWITKNIDTVQNVNVPNNIDIFGSQGSGVLYDFLADLEQEYSLPINKITYNIGEEVGEGSFKSVYSPESDDVVFYKEHYVIVSKTKKSIGSINQISNRQVGVLAADETRINQYLNGVSNTQVSIYDTSTSLLEALNSEEKIEFAIIPLEENLTSILTSNYFIDYHISDLNKYIVYDMKQNDTFSNIIKKYAHKWEEKKLEESINKNELDTFVKALSISNKEISNIQAKRYSYGFINNSPYEILSGGNYGGIVSEYLTRFSSFSNVEFTSTRYKNFSKFTEAIANKKVDIFYNYYNLDSKYEKIDSLMNISFVVIAKEDDDLIINSISSLTDQEIYVQKNSLLEKNMSTLGGINLKSYENEKELKRLAKKGKVLLLDKQVYEYYKKSFLSNYSVRYTNTLSDTYNFFVNGSDTFKLLFNKYIQTLDPQEIIIKGNFNHTYTVKSGTILGKVTRYSLLVLAAFIIILYLVYRSTKRIKITRKIKKEDKMKFIDQLTSLKNRNYLSENIANWNKNTIYPQATIIIDLNSVRSINDQLGYEQGDAQIKAAANVLIKTQLDNTDIMRTDGNEYLIYLVGYQEKQVVSYIRKLYKEFKSLPYEHGASIGYSMITNDTKTIEDSINESVEDMRKKKEEQESEQDGKEA